MFFQRFLIGYTRTMRINLFGGPCTRKSTLAAYLFAALKERGKSVELVTEYVKFWAYQNRLPQSLDQIYILAKQLHTEDTLLSRGVGCIITDSPVLLTAVYAGYYGGDAELSEDLARLSRQLDKKYRTLNLLIERDDSSYEAEGRFQTLEVAKQIDAAIEARVRSHYPEDSIVKLKVNNLKEEALRVTLDHLSRTL
jgi:nicotinamide riboside kinase